MAIIGLRIFSNLTYNSPFNDEAIYIVVGKLGLFQHDWASYNGAAWVSGWQIIYPSITAVAYQMHGIAGSRMVSSVVGIMLVEILALTAVFIAGNNKASLLAAILTAMTVGFSGTFYFLSRLATMDILSFFFLFASYLCLIKAPTITPVTGKMYCIAALLTVLCILTKYATVVVLPVLFTTGYLTSRNTKNNSLRFFISYYITPVLLLLTLYALNYIQLLTDYFRFEVASVHSPVGEVVTEIWDSVRYNLPFLLAGTAGMLYKHRFKWWILLMLMVCIIPVYHLTTFRVQTLNKHIFISTAAAGIISGVGLSDLLTFKFNTYLRFFIPALICGVYILYFLYSAEDSRRYDTSWADTRPIMAYFEKNSRSGDRILTESGSSIILANYRNNHPENIRTFDWFEYRKESGDAAYLSAVRDGYFSYIQLEKDSLSKMEDISVLSQKIHGTIGTKYTTDFESDQFIIYKRVY